MSVRIALDDPHAFYTNLDFISGRVILSLASDENVSAILVKLEGESRTILMRPTGPPGQRNNQRQGLAQENHKVPKLSLLSGTFRKGTDIALADSV